ncbi:TonB-dependent siderophore receptor [Cupriavidus sp. BIS7]|uniref:TonB-dependent receptor n=1 Tax=Cupriavidus sp. BIS7 TaxID=1217718 RepID=UPI0003025DB5|nr:TonB-dependent siderophore receptor [Cupriavidus sp. BIS7]
MSRPARPGFAPRPHAIAAIASALIAGVPIASHAQSGSAEQMLPAVTASADKSLPGNLNETVTTGTKTDTPLRDIPAAITVIPDDVLRDQGAIDMNYALQNSAGVQPVLAGGYGFANNYAIRGLAMRFLRDGYADGPSQNGYYRTMYDVDRIEVLKGPGSALYGSGQPGGTVNLVTKAPLSKFSAEVGAFGGSFGTWGTYVDVGGPVSSQLSTRLIADVEKSDGYRGLGRDIKEVSPSFSWAYDTNKTLTIDYDHRDISIVPDNYGIVFNNQGKIAAAPRDARYYSPFNDTRQIIDRVTVSHDWRIDPALTMRTAFIYDERTLDMTRNAGGNGGNALNQMTGRSARTQSDDGHFMLAQNELVWKTNTGPVDHTVLFGMEYSDTHINTVRTGYNLPNITNIDAPIVPETTLNGLAPVVSQGFNRVLKQQDFGVYLQDQLAFGDQFKIRAAVRTDHVNFSDIGTQGGAFRTIGDTQNLTAGSLGGVWQPTRTLSFYAGVSTSKFINVSTEPAALTTVPESSLQKEIGAKAEFLDGRLQTNVALFETERKNYYITLPGALSPTPDGRDKSRGVELELAARPLSGWTVLANFVLQNVEVESNTLASNASMGVFNRSIAGTRPAGVARTGGRLWTTYDFQQQALHGWGVGLGLTYKGDSYADSLNLYQVPSYVVLDAAVYYRRKNLDVTLNLRNLTDKTYYISPTFSGALPGDKRSAMLTARYRFQ